MFLVSVETRGYFLLKNSTRSGNKHASHYRFLIFVEQYGFMGAQYKWFKIMKIGKAQHGKLDAIIQNNGCFQKLVSDARERHIPKDLSTWTLCFSSRDR